MSIWQALPPRTEALQWAQAYGTPLYLYNAQAIRAAYAAYDAGVKIHYAVKANSNLAILKLLHDCGAGFDIVSVGELERCLNIGAAAQDIVFSGVAKSDAELRRALEVGVGCFNVESAFELQRLSALAAEMNTVAPIALRINPDVDAQTHAYISTGLKDNKFGIALDDALDLYRWAKQEKHLNIIGLACHIGSQITSLKPFEEALDCLLNLAQSLREEGISLQHLDMGGGLGVAMAEGQNLPSPREWVEALLAKMAGQPYALHVQPGRSLVANSAYLLTQVVLNKIQNGRHFVMVDAAMNDYLRPALYQAQPHFRNLSQEALPTGEKVDIVGPVCESGDTFIKHYPLSASRGDVLAMAGVGAYGMSMASQYNSRARPAEILWDGEQLYLIREREPLSALWQYECYEALPSIQ